METGLIDVKQVVQYILDLNDNRFSDGVIRQFTGNVCALSVQKFSSNVIEKVYEWSQTKFANFRLTLVSQCIRVAEPGTRKLLIGEMLNRSRLEKLLRDSYGNYCVQVRGYKTLGSFDSTLTANLRLRWTTRIPRKGPCSSKELDLSSR